MAQQLGTYCSYRGTEFRQLTKVCNSSFRGSAGLYWTLESTGTCAQTFTQIHTHILVFKFSEKIFFSVISEYD